MKKLLQIPLFNILIFNLFWSLVIVLLKISFNAGIDPLAIHLESSIFTLAIFIIYFVITKVDIKIFFSKTAMEYTLVNILTFVPGVLLYNFGISMANPANIGFLLRFSMVCTFAFSFFILKEKVNKEKIITACIIFLGVFLISTKGKILNFSFGDFIILAYTFIISLNFIFTKKIMNKAKAFDTGVVSFLKIFVAFLFISIFVFFIPFLPEPLHKIFFTEFHFKDFGMAFIVGVVSFFAYFFNMRTLKMVEVSYLTLMNSMMPIFVLIFSFFIFKENVAVVQFLGMFLICFASVFLYFSKNKKFLEFFKRDFALARLLSILFIFFIAQVFLF